MSDLDELMSRDPLDLSSADLDAIIDYHRKQRERRAAGEKPTKPTGPKSDLSLVMKSRIAAAKPEVKILRRL
jgi:hypothetical protein